MEIIRIFFAVIVLAIMVGCTAMQPLPVAARAGDSIVLALGSQDNMSVSNTVATFTPDLTGVPVPLTPRSIFNLYPDKRSRLYESGSNNNAGMLVYGTGHEQWITIMSIDLPHELPAGYGSIKIATTAQQSMWPNAKVEDVDYRIEIFPGNGQAHDLKYLTAWGQLVSGDIAHLERVSRQVHVIPPPVGSCTVRNLAAIEMSFLLPFDVEPYRDIEWFRVVADDFTVQTSEKTPGLTWGAKGNELKVVFMNIDGALQCYEARFSLVPKVGAEFSVAPQLISVDYYNAQGETLSGPSVSDYQVTVR